MVKHNFYGRWDKERTANPAQHRNDLSKNPTEKNRLGQAIVLAFAFAISWGIAGWIVGQAFHRLNPLQFFANMYLDAALISSIFLLSQDPLRQKFIDLLRD